MEFLGNFLTNSELPEKIIKINQNSICDEFEIINCTSYQEGILT